MARRTKEEAAATRDSILDAAEKLSKGSYPGQKPLKMEKTELVEKIFQARDQLRKCAAR